MKSHLIHTKVKITKFKIITKIKIKNYNIEINRRNFYDPAINDLIKQFDEVRKVW